MVLLELKNISKRFGTLAANDGIDLSVEAGEIHCLLGENGAGKTTLMKVLFGLYAPDSGSIFLRGKPVSIPNPGRAIALGIGMIHQNFMLAERLTVAENVVAGREPKKWGFLDMAGARQEVLGLSRDLGFKLDPDARVEDLSVGEQQRVEIVKVLHRNAQILVLDEPTAVLTPQESLDLFAILAKLKANGKTIIFITHKLKETMAISDRVTVLRDGRNAGSARTSDTDPKKLVRMMIGRDLVSREAGRTGNPGEVLLEVRNLAAADPVTHRRLKNINLTVREGEIVGIAGVEGNGQLELEEALMGLRPVEQGEIRLAGLDITRNSTADRRRLKIVHIPSDRLKRGLIRSRSLEQNLALGAQREAPFSRRGILSRPAIRAQSRSVIDELDIRCSGPAETVDALSGGNQQKLVVGRELSRTPRVIIAAQPTRGVDIGSVETIHTLLMRMRDQNKGILLISTDLDELLALSDRIAVIYEGELVAQGSDFAEEELGLLMAGQIKERGIDASLA